ncbi:MAG: SH3 domain-containing protein [Bacilli bacterium]|nr:SH3 domain-containing protein [Bacilli bacterium]
MKKLLKFLIVIAVVFGGLYYGIVYIRNKNKQEAFNAEIKEGMYLEVIYEGKCVTKFQLSNQEDNKQCEEDSVPVRLSPTANSKQIGTAKKGEIFKIEEVDETDGYYVWFRIVFQHNYKEPYKAGYIAQPRRGENKNVKIYNASLDYSSPTISFSEDEYHVDSIDAINYDHLKVWDDQPGYTITHEVYIERKPTDRPGPQYWIKYTVTDKVGKTDSRIQRIIFTNPPSDNLVKDFENMRK